MDLLFAAIVGLILLLVVGWLAIQVGSRWYAARPWTLSSAKLDQKFGGLIRFGKAQSHLSLTELKSRDRMTFTKRVRDSEPDSIRLEISSPHLNPETIRRIGAALDVLAPKLRWEIVEEPVQQTNLRIQLLGPGAHDPSTLEAVARLLVREFGHSEEDQYRVEFEGPADYEKVAVYYGWRR